MADLPSRFQLGDVVRARGVTGMVSGVCFRKAKVFYEVGGVMYASDDVMEPLRVVVKHPSPGICPSAVHTLSASGDIMKDVAALSSTQILSIPPDYPEKLFDGTLTDAKSQYRKLAARWHPDKDGGDTKVFAHVQVLFSAAENKIVAGTWRSASVLRFADVGGKSWSIPYNRARAFELGWCYYSAQQVVWSVELQYEDLLRNAMGVLEKSLIYKDEAMRKEHSRYLPRIESIVHGVDRFVIVQRKEPDFFLLRDVLEHFGGKLEPRHVAWLMSSLLNINCYLNFTGVVHHAISPDTLFVSPSTHSTALFGGWWYAARSGQRIYAVPTRTMQYGPSELKTKPRAMRETDSSMIRATGRELLGDISGSKLTHSKEVPAPMAQWLLGVGEKSAYKEYDHWYNSVLKDAFGARRFVKMSVEASDIYKEV